MTNLLIAREAAAKPTKKKAVSSAPLREHLISYNLI